MLIVVGGTLAATAIAFPTKELKWLRRCRRACSRSQKQEMLSMAEFLLECRKQVAQEGPHGGGSTQAAANALRLVRRVWRARWWVLDWMCNS